MTKQILNKDNYQEISKSFLNQISHLLLSELNLIKIIRTFNFEKIQLRISPKNRNHLKLFQDNLSGTLDSSYVDILLLSSIDVLGFKRKFHKYESNKLFSHVFIDEYQDFNEIQLFLRFV